MRDEKEERKKQARSNKQTRQSKYVSLCQHVQQVRVSCCHGVVAWYHSGVMVTMVLWWCYGHDGVVVVLGHDGVVSRWWCDGVVSGWCCVRMVLCHDGCVMVQVW